MNQCIDILLNHVSIRKYTDEAVNPEIKEAIISCAQMAPTSSHFQAYTMIEVDDKQKREVLYKISGNQKWVRSAALVLLFCGDLHRCKEYFEGVDPHYYSNTEAYTIATVDTACAAQKAIIAAQSFGLGGVFVGGIRNDVELITKEFNLPDLVFPLFALCLGYPADNPVMKPRLPKGVIHKLNIYEEAHDKELIDEYNRTVSNYYRTRTDGKENDTWTEHCGKLLMDKTREDVGIHFRNIGLLKR
ncbi:MAG: oxygen-insensitive NADPH nitroreductase [Bacillota bacterium]|nr:oxygen-insensitive NADPH nitroreductase [Bacillota bacterium]